MMSKIRHIGFALCAALVLGAAVANCASAAWFIEGGEATGTSALATTSAVDEPIVLLTPSISDLKVECSGGSLDGASPEIAAGNLIKAASLKFLSCNTTHPTGCALEKANQTISTLPINATVKEATFPDDKVSVAARTKSTLAEIAFSEANTCAFSGLEPVKGSFILNAPTLQEERASQKLEGQGSVENNSLEIGSGNKTYISSGKALLGLTSGHVFSNAGSGTWVYKTESSVEGEGEGVFTEGSVTVTCKTSKLAAEGLTAGFHETLSLAPSFKECEGAEEPPGAEAVFGGNPVTATVGASCKLRFNALKETAPGSGIYQSTVDLTDNTCVVTLSVLLCTVTIKGEQLSVGKETFQNIQFIPKLTADVVVLVKFSFTSALCLGAVPPAGGINFTFTSTVDGQIIAKNP